MTNRRDRRPVSGVLLLDKPVGWTSNAALQAVKRLYQAQKAGHTGSLDPLASGLLPLCLGEATKLSGLLLNADKSYRFTCCLGATTTTGDAEGEMVMTRPVGPLTTHQHLGTVVHRIGDELRHRLHGAVVDERADVDPLVLAASDGERPPAHREQVGELVHEVLVDEENPTCGDHIRLMAKVEQGKIVDVKFEGKGCAISTASASMMTERLIGMPVEAARAIV